MLIPFFSVPKKRYLMPLLVLLLLSGCGPAASVQPAQTVQTGRATPTPGPSPLGSSVAFDLGGSLHIQSARGFTCRFSTESPLTPGTLVLPTVQPTYDQGTLQSVYDYVNSIAQVPGSLDNTPYPAFSASPDAFQLADVDEVHHAGCEEILQIKNIGNAPVEISQIAMQLTAEAKKNNQHYNLIDLCSISRLCSPVGGGEAIYEANFDLHSGEIHTPIPATCWGYATPLCSPGTLMLRKDEFAKVILTYSASDNFSFSLMPIFTLSISGKQITYTVPQLQTTATFAAASQFSCYALQGQRFIEVPTDAIHWCM